MSVEKKNICGALIKERAAKRLVVKICVMFVASKSDSEEILVSTSLLNVPRNGFFFLFSIAFLLQQKAKTANNGKEMKKCNCIIRFLLHEIPGGNSSSK
jgi:hypothetical protein